MYHEVSIDWPGFEKQNRNCRITAQCFGNDTPGRTGTNYDKIVFVYLHAIPETCLMHNVLTLPEKKEIHTQSEA